MASFQDDEGKTVGKYDMILLYILIQIRIFVMIQRQLRVSTKSSQSVQSKQDLALDLQYLTILRQIDQSSFFQSASKHTRIRLEGWITKLNDITSNLIWKRNRNSYAKLINLICECEVVVDPFHSLPPQGDLPKLSKHKINSIIDAVERQVKIESKVAKVSTASSRDQYTIQHQSNEKDIQKQSKVEESSIKEEQSSFLIDRFVNTAELSNGEISFDAKNGQYLSIAESIKQPNSSKKAYFSDMKDKQNLRISSKHLLAFKKPQIAQAKEKVHNPRHIVVKLNIPTLSNENKHTIDGKDICQNQSFESLNSCNLIEDNSKVSLQGFQDGTQLQNYTLKTEMFDQDIQIPEEAQCDFSGQISQRCREKDQILKQQYFSWKIKKQSDSTLSGIIQESLFSKHQITYTQSIPSKLFLSKDSPLDGSLMSIKSHLSSNWEKELQLYSNHNVSERNHNCYQSQHELYLKDITENLNNLTD